MERRLDSLDPSDHNQNRNIFKVVIILNWSASLTYKFMTEGSK